MIRNNNLSPLPWYEDIKYQNHRKSYAFGNIYPLYTPSRTLLPFQFMRETRANQITDVKLYDKNGILVMDITTQIKETGLHIKTIPNMGIDVIVYPGIVPMVINVQDGIYYATITDGVQTWYSDMFTMVKDISNLIKIEYYCKEDLIFDDGALVFQNPDFRFKLYVCSELGKPDYVFEEEGEKRDGYFFPEKQISEKTYKFTFLAPEYLTDAMRIIRMCDIVKVTANDYPYFCDTFLITPKWQTQGDIASVETEFECATVIKRTGKAYTISEQGDFNNDFNNDFNK